MTASVRIKDVSHRFGNFQALKSIDLTISAGSFSVLLGPSGCGKTTLLSVLGGFIEPSQGSVLLDNVDVTHVPPAKRATTTMFQDYALFPHLTLQDNIGFGLRMRGVSKSTRHARAQELLEMVGLENSTRKKPHELSGGQRQRVALARALAVEPEVLLLDEPLGALDLKLRRQMQDELKAIQKSIGTTFIHVTHDQEEAMAIADEIIVMNAGRVEDSGSPESIYLRPKSVFSATFMGEANVISGTVREIDLQHILIETELGIIDLPESSDINKNIDKNDSVLVSYRPEHILREKEFSESAVRFGNSTLIEHAFFGTHQRCQLKAKNGEIYTANLPQQYQLVDGQTIALRVKRSSVVVLKTDIKAKII